MKVDAGALKATLLDNSIKIFQLFELWDEDGSGSINLNEFKRALRMLGIKGNASEVEDLFTMFDRDGSGEVNLTELKRGLEEPDDVAHGPPPHVILKGIYSAWDALIWTPTQACLYMVFVIVFNSLVDQLRDDGEYYFNYVIADTFIDSEFDSSHNTFVSVRRVADIYEWGNTVLWPGLLSNGDPHCGDVGPPGVFNSAIFAPPVDIASTNSDCNDVVWPEGEDSFHGAGATDWMVSDYAMWMNEFDWTEGISLRTVRLKRSTHCVNGAYGGMCLKELEANAGYATQATDGYGHNWTHPNYPLQHPFKWRSADELGSAPSSMSANRASFNVIPGDGYAAFIIPFFSERYLPEQRGNYTQVIDPFCDGGLSELGASTRRCARHIRMVPNYLCIRLSWNSEFIHQICDPNSADPRQANISAPVPRGRMTGIVRSAVEAFWNDLKRAHFVDIQTRALTITLPLRNNNNGVRSRASFLFELTSSGSILPSYDMEPRVEGEAKMRGFVIWLWIAFGFTSFFCILEGFELAKMGVMGYFFDMWNIFDWINFAIFFIVWATFLRMMGEEANRTCSQTCKTVGFYDDWKVSASMREGKMFLSLCCCIQLLKITKFLGLLVPKTDMTAKVLKLALLDLVFFFVVFMVSLFAFSMMFYVQLGPVMLEYNDQVASIFSLARALFGDFDMSKIMHNSCGYLNVALFLGYLFVAVFIMLSMLFGIFGQSQGSVRQQDYLKREEIRNNPKLAGGMPEYGYITKVQQGVKHALLTTPIIGAKLRGHKALADVLRDKVKEEDGPTTIERIEARQFLMGEQIDHLNETQTEQAASFYAQVVDMRTSLDTIVNMLKAPVPLKVGGPAKDRMERMVEAIEALLPKFAHLVNSAPAMVTATGPNGKPKFLRRLRRSTAKSMRPPDELEVSPAALDVAGTDGEKLQALRQSVRVPAALLPKSNSLLCL